MLVSPERRWRACALAGDLGWDGVCSQPSLSTADLLFIYLFIFPSKITPIWLASQQYCKPVPAPWAKRLVVAAGGQRWPVVTGGGWWWLVVAGGGWWWPQTRRW